MQPMKTKFVRVKDINIAYKIFGRGYPLVLIMGYMGTMDMWDKTMLNMLASHYRVIIFDNRGMGKTSASDKKFTVKLFADDIASFLDALDIKCAHVLGWSMGTNIALEFALKYPNKINKLILYAADCGGSKAISPSSRVIKQLAESDKMPHNRKQRFKFLFSAKWLKKNTCPHKYLPKVKEATSSENLCRQTKAVEEWHGVYKRLKEIEHPTLVITGTNDVLIPPANSMLIAQQIKNSWLVQVKNAGHGLMYQYPKGFSKILLTFLGA